MKKFLLTASMLVMGIVATFAQDVSDASKWQVGDEVTDVIKNPSWKDATNKDWTVNSQGGPTVTGGAFEVWRGGDNAEFYQFIQLPAGQYRLECQGYYRAGDAGLDSNTRDDVVFTSGNWVDYAFLSVRGGIYNASSKKFVESRKWETPLMPRLFEKVDRKIYTKTADQADWYEDTFYPDLNCYGPGSFPGSVAWFEAGQYKAYSQGDVKYNTVDFFVATDGDYVRIGVSKYGSAEGGETFFATNFKLYYEGEPSDEAKLAAKQDKVNLYMLNLEELSSNSNGLLKGLLEDALIEFGVPSLDTEEDCDDANALLTEIYGNATTMASDQAGLEEAIKNLETLLANTNFDGKAAVQAIIDDAKTKIDPTYIYEGAEDDNWETYKTLTEALYAKRLEYMKGSPKGDNGAQDFSAFINYPWFCNNEYSPKWNETAGCYQYTEDIEKTLVAATNEKSMKDLLKEHNEMTAEQIAEYEEKNGEGSWSEWVDIASDVTWTTKGDATGEWIYNHYVQSGWMGPIEAVTMQHGYTAVGQWSESPISGYQEMRQTITDLPKGYYSMGALYINAGNDPHEGQFVYIVPGTDPDESKMAKAQFTLKGTHWNQGGAVQTWRTEDWESLRTDLVYVEDGTLTIGSRSTWFYAVTGFQLYYYGETIDYAAMLQPSYDKAKEDAKELWAGDIKEVNAILAKTNLSEIKDAKGFKAASAVIAEANEYITKAKATITAWTGMVDFADLLTKQKEDSDEKAFVDFALKETTLHVGEEDNSVYTDAIANNNQYKAYVAYLDFRAAVGEFLKDDAVAAVVSEQNEYLKKNFATPEKLDEFKNAIGVPYNKAKFAALGANDATLDKPVDVSYVLINPSFHQGPETGWTVEGTKPAINDNLGIEMVDGKATRTIAELYDRNESFTFSQMVPGLPAGTYEIRTHALYRDGWYPDDNGWKAYNEAGGEENWANHNAILFGKAGSEEWNAYVKSIYSLKSTKPTFTYYVIEGDWQYDEIDKESYASKITGYLTGTEDEIPNELKSAVDEANAVADGTIPFDKAVNTGEIDDEFEDIIYYFPQRTIGLVEACKKDYNNYLSTVIVYLPEGGDLELGIKQEKTKGGDSLQMDDFQLFYLGAEAPDAIDEVAEDAAAEGAVEYYSVNGVKLSAPQAGFNIVKYANGQVKKIFIK